MPDDLQPPPAGGTSGAPEVQQAAEAVISLSQALLAPLDAIFKAQLHAARSFLNLLLQIGYPHQPAEATELRGRGIPYTLDFYNDVAMGEGKTSRQKISVPALALVPITPLAVESAEFTFDMAVSHIAQHSQIQVSERAALEGEPEGLREQRRPWYLVSDPRSIRGRLAAPASGRPGDRSEATIHVTVKVGRVPPPSGLDKLLTSLTQMSEVKEVPLT